VDKPSTPCRGARRAAEYVQAGEEAIDVVEEAIDVVVVAD
jgi:hypothetical protein